MSPQTPNKFSAPFALFERRMEALYQTDGDGRLVCTNEWEMRSPPRFHLMRTAQGMLCRFGAGLSGATIQRLEALCCQEPPEQFAEKLPLHYGQYLEVLNEHSAVQAVWSGPAYMALEEIAPDNETAFIDAGNAYLLRERMADWLPDVPHRRPFIAVVKDGGAVSICASVRITDSVHCAGVETHPNYRHLGYASDAVAAWASAVRKERAVPFYSTSWENAASQSVARRLQMTRAATDFHVR